MTKNQTQGEKTFGVINVVFLGVLALFTLYPMWDVVRVSLSPAADELPYSRDILPHIVYDGSHNIHFDANMVEGPDGIVYIAAGGRFCSVDPATMAVSTLVESDAKLLVADRFGHLYYTTRCGPPLGGTGGAMMTRYMVADE